jgi:hypothetical protein
MTETKLYCTLWPSFEHFPQFADDTRLAGIRLNQENPPQVPLFYDIKGMQLRVTEVHENPDYLDVSLNHPISVKTPTMVLFKAGADRAQIIFTIIGCIVVYPLIIYGIYKLIKWLI